MIPKEVILEDKYPKEDLELAEQVLSKGLPEEEVAFESGEAMIRHFRKRAKSCYIGKSYNSVSDTTRCPKSLK